MGEKVLFLAVSLLGIMACPKANSFLSDVPASHYLLHACLLILQSPHLNFFLPFLSWLALATKVLESIYTNTRAYKIPNGTILLCSIIHEFISWYWPCINTCRPVDTANTQQCCDNWKQHDLSFAQIRDVNMINPWHCKERHCQSEFSFLSSGINPFKRHRKLNSWGYLSSSEWDM